VAPVELEDLFTRHDPRYLSHALRYGLGFRERLAGGWAPSDAAHLDRPIAVELAATLPSPRVLWRDATLRIGGEVDARGLAHKRALSGYLELRRRTLWYRFDFDGDDGHRCRFVGEQHLSLRGVPPAFTVVEASIDRAGSLVGRAVLRFDLRSDLWPFLTSFGRQG
jgi:hypothetical protein